MLIIFRSIILLIIFLFLFLFPSVSSGKMFSNQRVGKNIVSLQKRSVNKIIVSSDFKQNYQAEGICTKSITNLIINGNLDDRSKDAFLYLTAVFWSVDSLISLSRSNQIVLNKEARVLKEKGKFLLLKSKKRLGKKLARSLFSQAFLARYYILPFDINFCQLEEKINLLKEVNREALTEIYLDVSRERPGFNDFLQGTINKKNPNFLKASESIYFAKQDLLKLKIKNIKNYDLAIIDIAIRNKLPSFANIVKQSTLLKN